ncbi:unnamed protein product [Prunus armeniaca]
MVGGWDSSCEVFRLLEFDQATHTLPACVAAHGQHSEVTFSPRMILVLSRVCRKSRISIRTMFEPRSDLEYCVISGIQWIMNRSPGYSEKANPRARFIVIVRSCDRE